MGKPEDDLAGFNRSCINDEAVNIEKIYFYKTDKRRLRCQSIHRCERVKIVLDIYGAAREREFDVDSGTNSGKNLLANDHFAASRSNTIANYIARELGITTVQIEINKN
ncbi:MAG: hypothetical protein WA131_07250 [Desulfitobacteriaceae bacterium]